MPSVRSVDHDLLRKLVLGQLPPSEVERLASEYVDDTRLTELAESLPGNPDEFLQLLHTQQPSTERPETERLVERLLKRLKTILPSQPEDNTAEMNHADVSTKPSSSKVATDPEILPEWMEHYRPIKLLGQGGMGKVYLAEDMRLGREVAIKTLRHELAIDSLAKDRFLREARSAAKLNHDNIVPIYSVGEVNGIPFLAMPFLNGEPLDALIRRTDGPLQVRLAMRLAREVASGLSAAHARGVIHRDIKPANIWLEAPTGRAKILDFGLAKAASTSADSQSQTNLTASGAIVGTPAYMAPEQANGHPVDARADLFSLGCVLYELVAGHRAFDGHNTMSILMSLASKTPPAPETFSPDCPPRLSRLVMRLLEKDPANRPNSADEVIRSLDAIDLAPLETDIPPRKNPSENPVFDVTSKPQTPKELDSDRPSTASRITVPGRTVAVSIAALLLLVAAVAYRIQTNAGMLNSSKEIGSATNKVAQEKERSIADTEQARFTPAKLPVCDFPPDKTTFPGKLVVYDTFDDPDNCQFPILGSGSIITAVREGCYQTRVANGLAVGRTFLDVPDQTLQTTGSNGAFAVRLKVDNAVAWINFCIRSSEDQTRWMLFNLKPEGEWSLAEGSMRKVDGNPKWGDHLRVAGSDRPDPELAGKFVQIAGHWSETNFEFFMNGKRAAAGPINDPVGWKVEKRQIALKLGMRMEREGPAILDLDDIAVWDLERFIESP